MNILLTADLHLTDRPQDEYRWGLFPWLIRQVRKHKVGLVGLLGDLTDAKDKHSEPLVNRVVDSLEGLGRVVSVVFDPGNHDGIQEGRPFFRFSNHIHNVTCLTRPMWLDELLFLPNTHDYKQAWAGLDFSKADYIFCHQTFDGCITENGTSLPGIPPSVFAKTKAKVFSGDIHVPQKIGRNIEYVGAPYRVRFGDKFTPRVLLLNTNKGEQMSLYFVTVTKHLLEIEGADLCGQFKQMMVKLDVREGDQVKLRVALPRAEYPEWAALRGQLKGLAGKAGVGLVGPELVVSPGAKGAPKSKGQAGVVGPKQALLVYAQRERLSGEVLGAGQRLLAGAMGASPGP